MPNFSIFAALLNSALAEFSGPIAQLVRASRLSAGGFQEQQKFLVYIFEDNPIVFGPIAQLVRAPDS